jgi:predicted transposase/invertase (TIGR01784 family)
MTSAAEIERHGREEGRKEGKLEVARKLLARGIPPDIIAESAEVSLDQIQRLIN